MRASTIRPVSALLVATLLSCATATARAEEPWPFLPDAFALQLHGPEGFDQTARPLSFAGGDKGPTTLTVGVTALSLAALLSTELFKDTLAPEHPSVTNPNAVDRAVRNALHWDEESMGTAALISDILLFGVFGTSVLWAPLLSDLPYTTHLEIGLETLLVTAFLTQTTKFLVGRERPYAFYDSQPARGADDNLSFFSGHTSLTVSLATTTAVVLSDRYPDQAVWAWTIPFALAATTAYLRMAADKHYFTDVLVGLGTGLTVGYVVSDWRLDTWRP